MKYVILLTVLMSSHAFATSKVDISCSAKSSASKIRSAAIAINFQDQSKLFVNGREIKQFDEEIDESSDPVSFKSNNQNVRISFEYGNCAGAGVKTKTSASVSVDKISGKTEQYELSCQCISE